MHKLIQSILQYKSNLVVLLKFACVTAPGLRRELVSNSMQLSTIPAGLEWF